MDTRGDKTASIRAAGLLLTIVLLCAFGAQLLMPVEAEAIFNVPFGGANQDVARSVQSDDGGYVIAGWTTSFGMGLADFWLIKIDSDGVMQWNKTYGGWGKDEAYSLCLTTDGGYVLAGSTESYGSGLSDFWLVKVSESGTMQWSKTHGGSSNDKGFCVRQTSDGGYIVAGYTESFGAGGSDYWLVKTDASGVMQWNRTYGGVSNDKAYSVAQNSDGGYIVAGETNSYGTGNSDYWLIRTDSSGNQLWGRTYGGASLDVATSVQQASDGGYIVAGYTESIGAGGSDGWLVKTDANGYMQWNRPYGEAFDEEAYSVQLTSDGGYLVAGGTNSYTLGGWDFWVIKVDASGNLLGRQKNGDIEDEKSYCVQPTGDGGYIAVGFTNSYGAGGSDFWVTKSASPPPRLPKSDHDVAVTGVLPSRTIIAEGSVMTINVTVANLGRYREDTVIVTVYANETSVDPELHQVSLNVGWSEILVFIWDTSSFTKGSYFIKAVADPVGGEAESALANNVFNDGRVVVTMVGDVQGDLKVDILDVLALGEAFGSDPLKQNWNRYCDFNDDDKIDSLDLQLLARNFGETCG